MSGSEAFYNFAWVNDSYMKNSVLLRVQVALTFMAFASSADLMLLRSLSRSQL